MEASADGSDEDKRKALRAALEAGAESGMVDAEEAFARLLARYGAAACDGEGGPASAAGA